MVITPTELALVAAVLPLIGVALGSRSAQRAAREQAQEQRRLEWDRRWDERRSKLYQDAYVEVGRLMTYQQRSLAKGPKPARDVEFDPAQAEWHGRIALLASPEVKTLWDAWVDVFAERWVTPGEGWSFPDWEHRVFAARDELIARMRRELIEVGEVEGPPTPHTRLWLRPARSRRSIGARPTGKGTPDDA